MSKDTIYDLLTSLEGEAAYGRFHHGYWVTAPEAGDRRSAESLLVNKLATFGGVTKKSRLLDAGCGPGETALQLNATLGCEVVGINNDPSQIRRAVQRPNQSSGVTFLEMDATALSFGAESFDHVWALESLEEMQSKKSFFEAAARVLRPNGSLVVGTWVKGVNVTGPRLDLFNRVCIDVGLTDLRSIQEYRLIAESSGFTGWKDEIWTSHTRPTWNVGSAPPSLKTLGAKQRAQLVRWTYMARGIAEAFNTGVVEYAAFTAKRHSAA